MQKCVPVNYVLNIWSRYNFYYQLRKNRGDRKCHVHFNIIVIDIFMKIYCIKYSAHSQMSLYI